MSRISPIILLVIVIIAIGFFVLGLLQLLIRCLMKRPSFSSISQSNRLPDAAGSHIFQRQLQQLFRLHDSGLDQAVIDALPVFYYKEIIGLREPFDCAVCLCEFSDGDKLKFLPNCTHAFHIHCIETWLLSNSTCPLCRSLIANGNPTMLFSFDESMEQCNSSCTPDNSSSSSQVGNEGLARIFSVRLGKFRSSNQALLESDSKSHENECTSSSIDGRRCYSMGAFQYIVGDTNLQVALSGVSTKPKGRFTKEQLSFIVETDGKMIGSRSRGDSYSVSKIWLWSKKPKYHTSCEVNQSLALPMPNTTAFV